MAAMSTVTAPPFAVRDAIALPAGRSPVTGRACRSDAYPIHVVESRAQALETLRPLVAGRNVAVVTDATVEALYGGELVHELRAHAADVSLRAIPAGEASKSLAQATALWHWLAGGSMGRRDVVLAFGGGVICDLAGWVASAYMRGLPYVNLPTTLLAQVDGAIGGKVAVNHEAAKNLIGAFHQPVAVVAAIEYLDSVDDRHLRAGLAESIKKAVIASRAYWDFIEGSAEALLARRTGSLHRLVHAAAAIKTTLIERDPYEEDLRRPLNFGHTIGHPLETVTGYGPLLHGEAVAFGMVAESRIAADRGLLDPALLHRLVALLRRCGLPAAADELPARITADEVVPALEKVRLIRDGSLRFVLPVAIGETVIADDVEEGEVRRALAACGMR
jgi:3-dehydroquinate synthase